MAIQIGIERYIPTPDVVLPRDKVIDVSIHAGGRNINHVATADFHPNDPWSAKMRKDLNTARKEGIFRGQPVLELGIGDGRNMREVGPDIKEVIGVDVEKWRLQVAGHNLVTGRNRLAVPVELWKADAVEFLQELEVTGRERVSGRVVMCLPQSPEGANATDRYNGSTLLDGFRTDYDRFGLTLNAAVLHILRRVANKKMIAFAIISGRVPEEETESMFNRMDWVIQRRFTTDVPVQQDPTTGTSWVRHIDDGRRFYERVEARQFSPISAIEAENRRVASVASGAGRKDLNVYHNLTVYQVRPNGKE